VKALNDIFNRWHKLWHWGPLNGCNSLLCRNAAALLKEGE